MNDGARMRRTRVRNRWFKAVTMINNPSLIVDRFQCRYRQRMNGLEQEDASNYQVTARQLSCIVCHLISDLSNLSLAINSNSNIGVINFHDWLMNKHQHTQHRRD